MNNKIIYMVAISLIILIGCGKKQDTEYVELETLIDTTKVDSIMEKDATQSVKDKTEQTDTSIDYEEKNKYQQKEESSKQTELNKVKYKGSKDYELQLLSMQDKKRINSIKRQIEKSGYKLKIVSKVVKGKKYYRLRIARKLTKTEASNLGDRLKNEFSFITDYWIDKVN